MVALKRIAVITVAVLVMVSLSAVKVEFFTHTSMWNIMSVIQLVVGVSLIFLLVKIWPRSRPRIIKEANIVTTQPTQEPMYDDIMVKLQLIEERIKKVDKRTRDILFWLWGVLIGALLGIFLPL